MLCGADHYNVLCTVASTVLDGVHLLGVDYNVLCTGCLC